MRATASDTVERALPSLVIVVIFLLGAFTLRPFAPALLWAVFITTALFPLHETLSARLGGRRGLATLATGLALVVVVLVPMLVLTRAILAFVPDLALALMEQSRVAGGMVELPQRPPATLQEIWAELQRDMAIVRDMVGEDLQLLVRTTIMEGKLVGSFVLEFLLGVLLATLMLHNGPVLARMARDACERLGGARGLELGQRSVVTIRSTVLGILGSAAAQTGVAAFAYWLVGAPHWPLLAFVTFLLGLLQVGPVLIWAPLAVWLWLDGHTGMAVFLALWGTFAVGLTDNLVKTLVVSRGADLPAILVFLGAIGGLLGWGVVGIFVGPVILAVCMELALSWLDRDRDAGERDVMAKGAANADGDA